MGTSYCISEALASTIHYNLIDIKGYAIVSVRKIPMLKGGK